MPAHDHNGTHAAASAAASARTPAAGPVDDGARRGGPGGLDFRALFEAVPGNVLVLGPDAPDFTVVAASDSYVRVTLQTRDTLVGRPVFEAFPDANPGNPAPTGVTNLRASLETVLRTRAPHRMAVQRYDLAQPDGAWDVRWWAPQNLPVLAPDGAVRYVLHHVEDVTERVQDREDRLTAERLAAALAASEARFRAVQDASPLGFAIHRPVCDAAGAVVDFTTPYVNDAGARVVGRSRAEVMAGTVLGIWPSARTEGVFGDYLRVLATGEPSHREVLFEHEDLAAGLTITTARIGAGADAELAVTFTDVTARLRAAAERERLLAAVRASAAREAFLLRLADGLRPLADPAEIQFEAARVLGEQLGAGRVAYFEVERDPGADVAADAVDDGAAGAVAGLYVVERDWVDAAAGVPPLRGRFPVASFGPALLAAYRAGRTVTEGDVQGNAAVTAAERAAFAGIQTGAYVGAPLVKDGAFVAGLAVHHPTARAWTADEVALVAETAERTWAAVERARAEAAREAGDARYQALVTSLDAGFCVLEVLFEGDAAVDYRYLDTNPAFVRQAGFDPAGRRIREIAPTMEAYWFDALGRVVRTGVPARLEQRVEALGRWFDVFAYRVDDPALHHVAVLFTDVTAARAAAAERERLLADAQAARAEAEEARSAAEAASRAKGEFLAVMSHELRTPLNAIGGYAQLLDMGLHGPVTDAQRGALARVQAAQARLLALINDVLNYAKLESGRVDYDVRPVDVADVMRDVVPLIEPQLRAKGLAFDVRLPDGPCVVAADREKLGQVLVNLLSNAVKFTESPHPGTGEPGRVTVEVATRSTGEAGAVPGGAADALAFLRVRDTGRGIAREKQDAIFEPFVQVRAGSGSAYAQATEGTGLGLAISRDLARGMGGDLRVRSAPGEGATFTVALRRVTPNADGRAAPEGSSPSFD